MKSNYQSERKQREKGKVPVLALHEFENRIRKIQANFKGKIEENQGRVKALHTELLDLADQKQAAIKEAAAIIEAARQQASDIISDADGTRHATLMDVEAIRVRAEGMREEAERLLAAANQRSLTLSLQAVQVDAAEARLRNLVKEQEYLRGLHAKIEAAEQSAKEHEASALAAETRAKDIWKQDEKTLAELSRTIRDIKQAPFYAAKKRR